MAQGTASGFRWRVGGVCLWLRDHFILRLLMLAGALVAAAAPGLRDVTGCILQPVCDLVVVPVATWWPLVVFIGGVGAALAVFADFIADRHEKARLELARAGEVEQVGKAISALLALLDDTIRVAFKERKVRADRLEQLRTSLPTAVKEMPAAANVRSTYYPLRFDDDGFRVLDQPVSRGRVDPATTVWHEKDDPSHPIWALMDGPDLAAPIAKAPEQVGIEWETRPYKTFISVPVKAGDMQFGMISVNAPVATDFTEVDRISVIVAARVMATALALETPTKDLLSPRRSAGASTMGTGGA